jgi:DNA repair exonuclease SbcCD ATPase subunit
MDYAFDFQKENSIKEYMLKNIVPLINQLVDYACQHIYQGQLYLVFDDFFSARIIYKGKEVTFEEFSDGEKARLNLIMNFVLFMIIRTMVADLNVMFLDEVFTFMDAFFIGKFVDYIKLVAPSDVSIYIISHESGMDTMLRPKKTILIKKKYDTSVVCDA